MTIAEVRFRVQTKIKVTAGRDDEAAHSMEDDLFKDVLMAIAKGSKKAQALAREALKSVKIEFPRHCS
jgi:hypothetical protein